jgi:hypothetical protein
MTSYVYTTENGLMVDSERAAFKGEVLSLEEIPKIKLNSDELLTESKELVGALNELFLAAPEGGDSGAQGFFDIAPHLGGYNIWYTAINLPLINPNRYPAYGVQYPGGRVITQIQFILNAFRTVIPANPAPPVIHYRVKIYGFNPGDDGAVLVDDIDYAEVKPGFERQTTLNEVRTVPVNNSTPYEYYLFIFPETTFENFTAAGGFEYPEVFAPYDTEAFLQVSYRDQRKIAFRYDYLRNMNTRLTTAIITGYYNLRENGWQYGSADIDAAIKAFNSGS